LFQWRVYAFARRLTLRRTMMLTNTSGANMPATALMPAIRACLVAEGDPSMRLVLHHRNLMAPVPNGIAMW
jgi:hypothetical protein